ncbi:hypothetical protein NNRS527_02173 [Nitrosospira sp. NRS527]|nr:hypothetical protein NNRS527_02173 [Nitrosospira sp. NRS527]
MRQKNNQSQSTISLLKFTPNPDYAIVIIVELLLLLLGAPLHFFTAVLPKKKSSQIDRPCQMRGEPSHYLPT